MAVKGVPHSVGRKVKRVEIDLSDVEGARLAIKFLQKLLYEGDGNALHLRTSPPRGPS